MVGNSAEVRYFEIEDEHTRVRTGTRFEDGESLVMEILVGGGCQLVARRVVRHRETIATVRITNIARRDFVLVARSSLGIDGFDFVEIARARIDRGRVVEHVLAPADGGEKRLRSGCFSAVDVIPGDRGAAIIRLRPTDMNDTAVAQGIHAWQARRLNADIER